MVDVALAHMILLLIGSIYSENPKRKSLARSIPINTYLELESNIVPLTSADC